MSTPNPQVDGYIRKNKKWEKELAALRGIMLGSPLAEAVKWRHPCYTFEGSNIVILGAFKEYVALTFVKGALLKDSKSILARPGENTQAARVIRLTTVSEIARLASTLKSYVAEAIEIEKAGTKVPLKKITEHRMPEELEKKLKANAALNKSFQALTPGRQRAYMLHFAGAKQSKTRESRIEKCIPQILKGKGLDD